MQGRGELKEKLFRVLRASHVGFSLRLWLVGRRGIQGYAPTSVTVPTALIIRLFKVVKISVPLLRVLQRTF